MNQAMKWLRKIVWGCLLYLIPYVFLAYLSATYEDLRIPIVSLLWFWIVVSHPKWWNDRED